MLHDTRGKHKFYLQPKNEYTIFPFEASQPIITEQTMINEKITIMTMHEVLQWNMIPIHIQEVFLWKMILIHNIVQVEKGGDLPDRVI
jgi:hypothetical protein